MRRERRLSRRATRRPRSTTLLVAPLAKIARHQAKIAVRGRFFPFTRRYRPQAEGRSLPAGSAAAPGRTLAQAARDRGRRIGMAAVVHGYGGQELAGRSRPAIAGYAEPRTTPAT
jgi:hypothetical protein